MNQWRFPSGFVASVAAGLLLVSVPMPAAAAAGNGSDYAFNEMILEMSGQDTGSQWFDYYVETVNQQIAYADSTEPYGAAGPSGPLAGFDGYLAGFSGTDTGSGWMNAYVDNVKRVLRAKQQ